MIKSLIIDDEPLARSIIREYLQGQEEFSIVQECADGFEGVKAIAQHQPDLIFLDIQMPKINGFEMLELIEQPPAVIFTTAFDEYAIKAFDARAVDYLLKPFSRERLEISLKKFMEQRQQKGFGENTKALLDMPGRQAEDQQRIVVKTGNHIRIIPVQEIKYIEACDDYVKIHSSDGVFLKKKTMQYFEHALDPGMFVRVHRSYILQLKQITRIESVEKETYVAITKDKERIPLSKNGYARLKAVLGL